MLSPCKGHLITSGYPSDRRFHDCHQRTWRLSNYNQLQKELRHSLLITVQCVSFKSAHLQPPCPPKQSYFESAKSVSQTFFTCSSKVSSLESLSSFKRTKFTLKLFSSLTFTVGPIRVQPNNERMATGSPLPPRLSSRTRNASGTLHPISTLTSLPSISGSSMPLRCGHLSTL